MMHIHARIKNTQQKQTEIQALKSNFAEKNINHKWLWTTSIVPENISCTLNKSRRVTEEDFWIL